MKMQISKLATRMTVLWALAVAGVAHAQQINTNVVARAEASACTADIAGGADLNWGQISHNALSPTGTTVLDRRTITLQVRCADGQKTHVAFWAVDTNPQTAMAGVSVNGASNGNDPTRVFGLGRDPSTGQKIGNFTLVAKNSSFDGTLNSNSFGYVNNLSHTASSFQLANFNGVAYGTNQEWTVLDSGNAPALANAFTFSFDVHPQLNTSKAISNAQEVRFNGTAQFYVRYF